MPPPAAQAFSFGREYTPEEEQVLRAVDQRRKKIRRGLSVCEVFALLKGMGYRRLTEDEASAYDARRAEAEQPEPIPQPPPRRLDRGRWVATA